MSVSIAVPIIVMINRVQLFSNAMHILTDIYHNKHHNFIALEGYGMALYALWIVCPSFAFIFEL